MAKPFLPPCLSHYSQKNPHKSNADPNQLNLDYKFDKNDDKLWDEDSQLTESVVSTYTLPRRSTTGAAVAGLEEEGRVRGRGSLVSHVSHSPDSST